MEVGESEPKIHRIDAACGLLDTRRPAGFPQEGSGPLCCVM